MYLYFDANGILKEIINDQSIRQGDYRSDVLYAYFEDAPENALMGVNIQYPDGTYSGEQTTSDTVTEAIPYDPNADHKWFKDYIPYKFYVYEFGSLAQAGVWRCTVRLISGTSIKAQGTFVFNVAEGAIEEDVNLTQAQYDALLGLLADVAYVNRSNLFSQANTFDGITTLNGLPMVTDQRIAGNLADRGIWWTIDDNSEGTSISVGDFAKTSAITLRVKDGTPTIEWWQNGQSGSLTLKDGEIATQEDLEEKQDTLVAGDGIVIQGNVITAAASKVIDSLEEGSPFPVSSDALYGVITILQNTVNGKSRAFALSYNDTSINTGDYQRYHYIDADKSVKGFESAQELTDYISGYTNMNAIFNSQADTISITASNTYIIVRQTNTYFATYLILRKPLGTGVFENITIALGDIFLVYETDVPDRWLSAGPYSSSGAVWSKMETAKIDITNMMTTDTEQTITATKTFTQPIRIPAANEGGYYEIGSRNGYYLTFDHYTSGGSRDGTPLNLIYGTRIDTYHIRPSINNTYDIGSADMKFRNIYLSGSVCFSDSTNTYNWTQENDGGDGINISRNGVAMYSYGASNFRPSSSTAKDLGNTVQKWRDIYLSGDVQKADETIEFICPQATTLGLTLTTVATRATILNKTLNITIAFKLTNPTASAISLGNLFDGYIKLDQNVLARIKDMDGITLSAIASSSSNRSPIIGKGSYQHDNGYPSEGWVYLNSLSMVHWHLEDNVSSTRFHIGFRSGPSIGANVNINFVASMEIPLDL